MRLSLLAAAAVPASLWAQAPKITPAGDPSVAADTIYRIDPEAGSAPYVQLLDDGVIRYDADGRGTRTYRGIVYINKQEAVEEFAERRFSFSPAHEKLTVNWTRVVRPDGTVLSDTPALSQDADVPAAANNPVYSEQKVRRLSLAKVAPGTIVDVSYTIEEEKPSRPGDFLFTWSVHSGQAVKRSRYIVDLPATLKPAIKEENLPFARKESVVNGRRVLTWATTNVPRIDTEPFASDSNGIYQEILIAGAGTWADIGAWYAQLAKDRATLGPRAIQMVDSIVAGAATRDDSIRAVHRWIAQDIRYVSVALGIGSYRPRLPDEVIASGFGDCKDKATLFVASLGHLHITAYPVLLSSFGHVERDLPSIRQFNHMIAAVPGANGTLQFADLTADIVAYGVVPFGEQGGFALLVQPNGRVREVTLPQDAIEVNVATRTFNGSLAPDGVIAGSFEQEFRGVSQYQLRAALMTRPDSTQRARMANSLAGGLFPGATGDSLQLFDGKDLRSEPRIALSVAGGHAARVAGGSAVLSIPGGASAQMLNLVQSLEKQGPRRFPIDAAKIVGSIGEMTTLRIALPAGWKAHLPPDIHAISRFGRFEATYTQQGTELTVERRVFGARGVMPPDAMPELIRWLKEIAAADAEFIILDVQQGA